MKKHCNFKDRVGEKHITNEGYTIEITECFGCKDCTIKFDNIIIKNNQYVNIVKGRIKNPFHKSVCGFGYVGLGSYSNKNNHKIYTIWVNMLHRCYDEETQKRQPTYIECIVGEIWHNFQVFAKWYEENYKEGWVLDKDILIKGNKTYSPETCCFVPSELNNLILIKKEKLKISTVPEKNKFIARIRINSKDIYLGIFSTYKERFEAYKGAKEKYIKEKAEEWKNQITDQTYKALINYQVEITT